MAASVTGRRETVTGVWELSGDPYCLGCTAVMHRGMRQPMRGNRADSAAVIFEPGRAGALLSYVDDEE